MAYQLRITVLKKHYFEDLVDAYSGDRAAYPPCEMFEVGQVFEVTDLSACPEGFCDWAWENIGREMASCLRGDELLWVSRPHTYIACCTDGFRPVVFMIERVEG